jgi:nicotinamide riboside transporter PnuC
MFSVTTTTLEWVCTLLSIYGSWLCIQKRVSGFVVFLVADVGWFVSAGMNSHSSLLAQQFIYILLNIVGYVMWRRDERLRWGLESTQANRDVESFPANRRYPDLLVHVAA